MPSPFPGMDPYLEAPALWRGVHIDMISRLRASLNGCLPPGYVAHIDERLYVVEPDRDIFSDVLVVGQRRRLSPKRPRGRASTALVSDPPYFVCEDPIRVREPFINIERVGVEGAVITTLEVLSPTNKDSSNPGNALYKQKQREVLGSSAHLVEIDLLRRGQHTVAASRTILNMHGPWHYVVCLHRAGQGLTFETWPVSIRERLPRFLIPLAEGDADVVLDLQAVLQRC